MSASESIAEAIAERWLACTLSSYPAAARVSLGKDSDPFRNPAGHLLREHLPILTRELLGEMHRPTVAASLDAIVRLRAVQGFTPAAAVGFVFGLRDAVAEVAGANVSHARIDELALMAFDVYLLCREQLNALRAGETHFRPQCVGRTE